VADPLYLQIYQQIVEEIKAGKLKTGDRVPSEKELADQHGVSRITSKKALEMLEQASLILRERGRGSFVAETLPDFSRLGQNEVSMPTLQNGRYQHKVIGLIIPDFSDSFGTSMLRAIERRCAKLGYFLILKMTAGLSKKEFDAIESLVQFGADGLIIFPVHGEYYNAKLVNLILQKYPLVLVDRYLKGLPAHAVYTNNEHGAMDLTQYLLDKGHQHIAFVSPPSENTSTIEDRFQGYRTALLNRRILFDPRYCFDKLVSTMPSATSDEMILGDRQKLQHFLLEHPQLTGFLACEYNIAVLLSQVLVDLGRHGTCEIVCFDSPANATAPYLFTHIRQNETAIGQIAVEILSKQLQGEAMPIQNIVDYELIVPSLEA
jgi:GntR family transcriptional regulator, arabinose operon transcriptional repressor